MKKIASRVKETADQLGFDQGGGGGGGRDTTPIVSSTYFTSHAVAELLLC